MNQIKPHLLWLGHAREGCDFRKVFGTGIQAVIELALEEPPSQPPRELLYCRFPLLDGVGNESEIIGLAVRTVATLLKSQVPTLVCCGAGMSRSPAIAAAALAVVQQEAPEECLKRVVAQHRSDISPGLWKEVTQLLPSLR
jgi:protein-tyrosine phosphatase